MGAMSFVKVTGLAAAFAGVCALTVAVDSVAHTTAAPTRISFVITASAVTSAEYLGKNDAPIPARTQDRKSRAPGHFCGRFRLWRPAGPPSARRSPCGNQRRPLCSVGPVPRLPSQSVLLLARVVSPDNDAGGHAAVGRRELRRRARGRRLDDARAAR